MRITAAVSPIPPEELSTPVRVSAAVSPIPPEELSTPVRVSAAVSPILLEERSMTPVHVSAGVSPIHLGESSVTRVSRGISPMPIKIFDLLPSDFPFTLSQLYETQNEPQLFYTSPQPSCVIVSDLEPESDVEIVSEASKRGVISPEIVSKTEPESD
jgi:hypothetical protein